MVRQQRGRADRGQGSGRGPSSATALILALASVMLFIAGLVFIGFYVDSVDGPHLRYLGVGFLTACAAFVMGCLVGLVVGIPRFVSSGAMRHEMEARRGAARAAAGRPAGQAVRLAVAAQENQGTPTPAGAQKPATAAQPITAAEVVATQENIDLPQAALQNEQVSLVPSSQLTPSTNLAEISDWLTKLLLGAGLVELTRLGRPLTGLVDGVARAIQNLAPGAKLPDASVVIAAGILTLYLVLGFLDGYVVTTVWYGKYLERLEQ